MHLIENYSFQAGQQIDQIHTFEKYYPGLPDKYIVIQPFSKPSKNYSNWEEILDLIFPILQKNGIQIVQVGGKDEKPLKYCMHTQGNTSWGHLQYIISKSLLVLSTDSVSSHLGGHYDKKLVTLISNNYSSCIKPYFGDKSKQIILEPDRTNLKPIFALDEQHPKQIDSINPEKIAKSVLELLNLNFDYPFKTVSIGNLYTNKILESAVTDVIDIKKMGAPNLIMRMDINNNYLVLQNQLSLNPCQIICDTPIPIEILKNYRPNILNIIYRITENHNPNFIKTLNDNKISYQLISNLSDEKLNLIKLDYMDFNMIIKLPNSIPDKLKNKDLSKVYFKSGKILLGNKKFYSSYYEFINNNPILNPMNISPHQINNKNLDLLWEESEHMIFLEEGALQ